MSAVSPQAKKRSWNAVKRVCPDKGYAVSRLVRSDLIAGVAGSHRFQIDRRLEKAWAMVDWSVNSSSPPSGTPWAIRLTGTECFCAMRCR